MSCELIVALDAPHPREVTPLLARLQGDVRWAKIGLEMFNACGPDCVREIAGLGFQVFLDLKLHDIPNTVARSVESVARLPIAMLTMHTAGGREMLARAVRVQREKAPNLKLLGVTVLTSMGPQDLADVGVAAAPEAQVLRLGKLAVEAGLTGLVCSPLEIAPLRAALGRGITLVTPGVRPRGADIGDQSRVMTPSEAAKAGADFIVVGRPILRAPDTAAAARAIVAELKSA